MNKITQAIKILIVDDSATQRAIYRSMLSELHNCSVIEANDGREGVDAVKEKSPDIIITDISMPNMDGLEMVKIIKSNESTKYIPIICASATFQDISTKMKALTEIGAEEYFYMPQTKDELLAKVIVMIRVRKLYLELIEKNRQLKQFNEAAVGRELKMIELKEKIKTLEKELTKQKNER